MNAEEIEASLRALTALPKGQVPPDRLAALAEEAAALDAPRLEASVLIALGSACRFTAQLERLPSSISRLLVLERRYPSEAGGFAAEISRQMKWLTTAMIRNPAMSLETVYGWLDELESRYRRLGYSLRQAHADRSELALLLGDDRTADTQMLASIAAQRDAMSPCPACEHSAWGDWRAWRGDDDGALDYWAPIMDGSRKCVEEPHRVLSRALLPLLRLGRLDEARGAFLRGYPMVKGNINLVREVGEHIEFCALTGNEARGLEILAEHADWLTDAAVGTWNRLCFVSAATMLLQRLSLLGHDDLPAGPVFTVASLLTSFFAELDDLCSRYDQRHGNSAVSDRVVARLAQAPLAESLPLGFPARLPAASPVPAPAPAAGESAADLVARAEELDERRHPGAEQAWARVAAAGADQELPAVVAVRVTEMAASFKLLADDPALARKTLLEAADSYAALPDRPAEFRARSTAARALAAAGEHDLAQAESAELTGQAEIAFAKGELRPGHYLAVRVNQQVIAAHALQADDRRTPPAIDAVVAGVTNTLAVIERFGDHARAGDCHDLLARIALMRDATDDAPQHLHAAREAYLAARQPWFAAEPTRMLAQFALRDGDAPAAESYAREALLHGIDLEPEQRAMTSSLLVEALTRQPDKEAEVADAALSAADRWAGISETDSVRSTVHAARAYASLDRHGEAAALYDVAVPRAAAAYDPVAIAMTREQYGRSLSALGQHGEAAAQFREAAQAIADDDKNVPARARLAAAAATSLQHAGQPDAALAAFRSAAELFGSLGDVVNRVRCLRSAAWAVFYAKPESDLSGPPAGVVAMSAVFTELEPLAAADGSPELAAELEHTRTQLTQMFSEQASRGS